MEEQMIVLAFILAALAGIAEAVLDVIQHKFDESVFRNMRRRFWDPEESWRNKWKMGDKRKGEKFWGSSTIFVWTIDAWHLAKSIRNLCFWAMIIAIVYGCRDVDGVELFVWVVGLILINRIVFEIFYSRVFTVHHL